MFVTKNAAALDELRYFLYNGFDKKVIVSGTLSLISETPRIIKFLSPIISPLT
jgi:hypothetical protein